MWRENVLPPQAFIRAPWSFMRNTDDRYGVKVVSEEAFFLEWRGTPEPFRASAHFSRLKGLGFDDLVMLPRFLYRLDLSVEGLMVRGWMDGLHDYCSPPHWTDRLDEPRTPGGEVEVLFVGNLEARPTTVVLSSYAPEGGDGWTVALRTSSGRPA